MTWITSPIFDGLGRPEAPAPEDHPYRKAVANVVIGLNLLIILWIGWYILKRRTGKVAHLYLLAILSAAFAGCSPTADGVSATNSRALITVEQKASIWVKSTRPWSA